MTPSLELSPRPVDRLIDQLESVREVGPRRWSARCPAHEDRNPSLSLRELDDGRVLLHCFSGCPPSDVIAAVGLTFADLFPDRPHDHRRRGDGGAWIRERQIEDARTVAARDSLYAWLSAEAFMHGEHLTADELAALASAAGRLQLAAERLHTGGRR